MWRFMRPDAKSVWKDNDVIRRLSRYRKIIDDKRWAKYLLAKDIIVSENLEESTEQLWAIHQDYSDLFDEYMENVDTGSDRKSIDDDVTVSFLDLKIELANRILMKCHFCERKCGVDRTKDNTGWCKLDDVSRVSSAFLHSGEEAPLVPSGTIFFSSCCFGCVFCQNDDISTNPRSGSAVTPPELAVIAERLFSDGAININYVGGDPIPNTHTILASMRFQASNVTQLWNSNLYCSIETMRLLCDVFDVWLPDFKYGNNECGMRLSGVKDYFSIVSRNHLMAYNSGEVIIRHLVMPNHLDCCTIPILEWIAENMPQCMVNIMAQYRPEHLVLQQPDKYPEIGRRVLNSEMRRAQAKADELGICWRPVS
ncbi:MAG: 4Fe-4S cluster-binding domain-containing protein [Candidatus Lokiarchaeota archaeon]|nr:4Fe-4S cluster-binding domain-containing protein [Candidatus Lokiarchaeota archaeon]